MYIYGMLIVVLKINVLRWLFFFMGNLLFLLFYYFLMFVFDVGVIDGVKDG